MVAPRLAALSKPGKAWWHRCPHLCRLNLIVPDIDGLRALQELIHQINQTEKSINSGSSFYSLSLEGEG
jgi:hypothetical protein